MRLLLIEDDDRIAADAAISLSEAGFAVTRERDGTGAGASPFIGGKFAAIVLDLGLPGVDGLHLLKQWRERGIRTPVLILTARGSWIERVEGLDAGADDYLPKPFRMEELIARLRAILRRETRVQSPILRCGDFEIDTGQMCVSAGGQPIALTPQEFSVVNYLVTNCGRVVSAGELIQHVHGDSSAVTSNAMEALIARIRRKMGSDHIKTRRGFGYIVPGPRA